MYFVSHFLLLVLAFQFANSGIPGVFCPVSEGGAVVYSCSRDCERAHCAVDGGVCDDNYNCICSEFSQCTAPFVQCVFESPTLALACNIDCQCNHGAADGTCDYEAKGCKCGALTEVDQCPIFLRTPEALLQVLNTLGNGTVA